MPTVLHLNPQEIDSMEKRSAYTLSIVGCDETGILLANAFADVGFRVICSDADPSVIKKIAKGKGSFNQPAVEIELKEHVNAGRINSCNDVESTIAQSDIILLTVSPKIDTKNKVDYSQVLNICKQIGACLKQGILIIYCGIAGFGFTEGILKDTLENTSGLKAGKDFGLAYHQTSLKGIFNGNLKAAASDQTSLNAAIVILKTISKNVISSNHLKVGEVATLFTIAKQDVNRALANELALLCERASIDYYEVLKLIDFNDSILSPTVIEEENKSVVYLLLDIAESLNAKLRLAALSRQINESMIKHAVNLAQEGLRGCGKTIRRAKVAILGVNNTSSSVKDFVVMLENKGAKVTIYDPKAKKGQSILRAVRTRLSDAVEGADCIVILPGQEQINRLNLRKLKVLMRMPSVIIDLTGTLEPEKVRTEGFLYYGLGRGAGS